MNKTESRALICALVGMVEHTMGRRGVRDRINPYCIPELQNAMKTLKAVLKKDCDWRDITQENFYQQIVDVQVQDYIEKEEQRDAWLREREMKGK